jgi:transposase, IS5 family
MAWKNLKQSSLGDALLIDYEVLQELNGVHGLIDWSRLEQLLINIHSSTRGEKAWPPLMMFKALQLQSGCKLSDPALENQRARDLLFRRFVELYVTEPIPYHITFWHFCQQLEKGTLMGPLIKAINGPLIEQGLYIKSCTVSIVDTSSIESKQCRPNKAQGGGSTPNTDWNVEAGFDGKYKSAYHFKAHLNVDEDGLIKATDFTSGSEHDSNCFADLQEGDESATYAERAYQSQKHADWLLQKCIGNRLTKRAFHNCPLTPEDRLFNRSHLGVRSTVERVFGVLKLHYGMAKAHYLGIKHNRTRFQLMCVGHNIKRGRSIQQASCA